MKTRDHLIIVDRENGGNHRYGFDLYFATTWCHQMYAWCEDQFGPPYDSHTNPDGVWSRYHGRDWAYYTQVRFEDPVNAVAFKLKFL